MNPPKRHVAKVYGKKGFVPTTNTSAASIFTAESPNVVRERTTSKRATRPISTTTTLEDVTAALGNVRLDRFHGIVEARDGHEDVSPVKDRSTKTTNTTDFDEIKKYTTRISRSAKTPAKATDDPRKKWLQPLTSKFEKDGRHELEIRKWTDILDENWHLQKIAESSYAEVYKVINSEGTSVLKVMALKPPTGPGSQRETAVAIESVVSEVMIMDMMAETPGFLEFKGAHIIEGKAPKAVRVAYDAHATKNESFFPRPGTYHRDQLFLALELGDAGTDIEHFHIMNVSQIWDIFFGTVIALSHGEETANFEHRDLHEGNICVNKIGDQTSWSPLERHRFGYSGLQVTLLDYTLSRATQNGITTYLDLENDLELFKASELLQHQMYRRMRVWAFFKSHGISHPSFDEDKPSHGSWKNYMPYTNVIWIYYIFNYIIKKYEGETPLMNFLNDTEELQQKLDPDRRSFNGGFTSANEILGYCVKQGWIEEEDLLDLETSSILNCD